MKELKNILLGTFFGVLLIGIIVAAKVSKPRLIPEPDKPDPLPVSWLGYATVQAPVQDKAGNIKLQQMTFSNVVIGVRSDGMVVWVIPNNKSK